MQAASDNNASQPYLSVVVTARNDDHGGNLLRRMQTFVNALVAQAKRHAVSLELVVVDWNPPPEKPPLAEALHWPSDLGPVEVRFIEVPSALHSTYRHGASLPLYQMIAKNVGIRRARGKFILATNIDVVFSHELFEFFAQQRLEPGRMYRIDRHDAMQDVPVDASIDEQLRYCETHLIRINTRQGSFPVNPAGERLLEPDDIASTDSGISLGKGWYPLEGEPPDRFRWVLNDAEIVVGPLAAPNTLILDVEPGPGLGFMSFALQVLDEKGVVVRQTVVLRRQAVRIKLPRNASPSRIRLHVPTGGLQIASDPRILNFRVFSLEWDHPVSVPEGDSASSRRTPVAKPGRSRQPRSQVREAGVPLRIWRQLSRLRSGDGPVEVGFPLPAFFARRWKPRLRGSAVSRTALADRPRPRSRTHQRPEPKREMIPDGLDLLWGRGWYPQENFKGERFRWAHNGAELILHTPEGEPRPLRLRIEPGPELGYGPFHLRVRDSSGHTFATATVTGRQWIELPAPWQPNRTQVLSLHAHGDAPARVLPNDPRNLRFRVLAHEWASQQPSPTSAAASPAAAERETPWTPISGAPGILLGYGWRSEILPQGGRPAWQGGPGAEIVVQQNDVTGTLLMLEVEPLDSEEIELAVLDGGRRVAARTLRQRERIRIPVDLQQGQTAVLQLHASRLGGAPSEQSTPPAVRLVHVDFEQIGRRSSAADSETDPRDEASAEWRQPPGPAFLHTNACGDFTLLAREHWFDLRGYPEFDLFSMNLDSVFCYAAHHGGAPEELLADPMRVYHIEHATGSGFTPEGQEKLFKRIAAKGLSWIDYPQVMAWAAQMRHLEAPMIFNHEDWGFEGIELAERRVYSRATAPATRHSTQGG